MGIDVVVRELWLSKVVSEFHPMVAYDELKTSQLGTEPIQQYEVTSGSTCLFVFFSIDITTKLSEVRSDFLGWSISAQQRTLPKDSQKMPSILASVRLLQSLR